MITKLAKSTTHFFVQKNIIKADDEKVYAYGMELLFSTIMNIFLVMVIAAVSKKIIPILIYMTSFIILRQFIGGYHAKTHIGCMGILAVVLTIFIYVISTYKYFSFVITVTSCITSGILVFRYAPVEHPNNPLSDKDIIILRKKSIISLLALTALIAILSLFSLTAEYGMYISLGILTASLAMVCEILKSEGNR